MVHAIANSVDYIENTGSDHVQILSIKTYKASLKVLTDRVIHTSGKIIKSIESLENISISCCSYNL